VNTCETCKHANRHTLRHRDLLLCSAPQLARDPVTGEVVVGARYVRGDVGLCGHEGRWHVMQAPKTARVAWGWLPRLGLE